MRGCLASTSSSSSSSANFSASSNNSGRLGAIGLESNWRRRPLKKTTDCVGGWKRSRFCGGQNGRGGGLLERRERGRCVSSSSASRGGFYALAAKRSDEERPIVVIDNYDSFTYNLVQYLGDCGIKDPIVFKNDEKTVEEIRRMNPKGILVSPGPGRPEDSGISLEVVEKLGPEFGVFGVCMGHQCIGQVFGGTITRAPLGLMHGKSSPVFHKTDVSTVLSGLSSPFEAARYHSLVISNDDFPHDELESVAWTEDDVCMAVKHKKYPKIQGVQFHPESIITDNGVLIIENWVKLINEV